MVFYPFWTHFGTPGPKILGNQSLEVSGNALNELSRPVNGGVGQKSSILALLVWKLWYFNPFGPILAPLGPKF